VNQERRTKNEERSPEFICCIGCQKPATGI
jgi:hypothetical protein